MFWIQIFLIQKSAGEIPRILKFWILKSQIPKCLELQKLKATILQTRIQKPWNPHVLDPNIFNPEIHGRNPYNLEFLNPEISNFLLKSWNQAVKAISTILKSWSYDSRDPKYHQNPKIIKLCILTFVIWKSAIQITKILKFWILKFQVLKFSTLTLKNLELHNSNLIILKT